MRKKLLLHIRLVPAFTSSEERVESIYPHGNLGKYCSFVTIFHENAIRGSITDSGVVVHIAYDYSKGRQEKWV